MEGPFCIRCGVAVKAEWRFCEACGADQSPPPTPSEPAPPAKPRRSAPPLQAHAVEVRAGGKTLLQPTALRLDEGELVAIIGPSGSGKSTLLKAVGGIRPTSAGSVSMRGDDIGLRQADVGYVPQDDTLHH